MQQLARGIASTILEGFNRHFSIFQQITSGAYQRFESADWRAVHRASRERIVLYDLRVEEAISLVKELFHITELDQDLWQNIKLCYVRLLAFHRQPELAETFYNSVFCRQFHRRYYNNDYIFLRNAVSTDYISSSNTEMTSYSCYYPNEVGLKESIRRLILERGFSLPFENLERDLRQILRVIARRFPGREKRFTHLNFQLQVICRPFFRNKGAYIVGRYINGRDDEGFALPILNNEQGQLYVDTLLIGDKELSVVFSYS
ncbi:MAG: bifunctional isocitrate dehydrogenase kinase/phosphatase, partial [Thiothrix sp.]|nr:bifunctional isocitrate dehydrogenase kinase/phosphatase [Thiothrix sp.]